MNRSLWIAAAALATIGAFYTGPATAQSMPMVPPANSGPVPVMPTNPGGSQPMPMPGSTAPSGPMIPRTMPTFPGSPVPMPMPGTTTPTSSKPVIQISLTLIDAPPSFSVTGIGSKDTNPGAHDDLHLARSLAASRHIVLTTVSRPTVTTLDGTPATLTTTQPATLKPNAVTVGDTMTATPHINPDGTVTVKVAYTHIAGPSVGKTVPPKTVPQTLDATRTFHNGDTLLLGGLTPPGPVKRLLFATATVVPPGKG
jgi:hypothetical protein